MAKDEPAELIKLGATAWNSWRAEHDEAPNLSGASLRGLDLSGFDLSLTDLRAADLRGTRLCEASLGGAHLEGANFSRAPFFSTAPSSSRPGTGRRPSATTRSPAAQPFRRGLKSQVQQGENHEVRSARHAQLRLGNEARGARRQGARETGKTGNPARVGSLHARTV